MVERFRCSLRVHSTLCCDCRSSDVQLADLATSTILFPPETPVSVIETTFLRNDHLWTLLVGDVHRPTSIGLVERSAFLTFLSGRLGYGRAIYSRKTIAEFDAPQALLLEPWTAVVDAATLAIARGPGRWSDAIALSLPDGFAVVSAAALFKHVTNDLAEQLSIDSLTGVCNRRGFLERVESTCKQLDTSESRWALVLLDLDGFKLVNDALGHQAGDQLLQSSASRIRRALPAATVARMGGDEFAALIPLVDGVTLGEVGLTLVQKLGLPTSIAGTEVIVPASVGITDVEPHLGALELIHRADVALYRAKGAGRNCFCVFDLDLNRDLQRQLSVSQELRVAITDERLELHYQPVVDLDTGHITAFEALARWTSPPLGAVAPMEFIELADRTGLIVPLGRSLQAKALRALAQTGAASTANVHVNVSRRELHQPDLVRSVKQLVGEVGLDPRRLVLEVTETSVAVDAKRMITTLHELADFGVRLALDDFGSGVTALSNLWQFPLDIVKLDISLVAPLANPTAHGHDGEARVGAMIDLCHAHDLVVTAEGVEHPQQADVLRRLGCDYAQGWYFGRPSPVMTVAASESQRVVASRRKRPCCTKVCTLGPTRELRADSRTRSSARRTGLDDRIQLVRRRCSPGSREVPRHTDRCPRCWVGARWLGDDQVESVEVATDRDDPGHLGGDLIG